MLYEFPFLYQSEIGECYYDPVPESKALKESILLKEQLPFFMNKFESIVKENGGYLVNGRVSIQQ